MATLKNTLIDDTGYLQLPSGTTAERPSSPSAGYTRWNTTEEYMEIYDGTDWKEVSTAGGPSSADIEYLVVAGGGGGSDGIGGGGGAGGYLSSSLYSIESGSSITVTVGAGGTGGDGSYGTSGVNSSIASVTGTPFNTVTSIGGGHGGYQTNVGDGGSGGGGSGLDGTFTGGSGTAGQGFDGGTGAGTSGLSDNRGGGGGGASEAGTGGKNITGNGGDGKQSSITGTATYYAGGGGGSKHPSAGSYGAGGLGGGGNGDVAGTANTGGGGGGSLTDGRAGGSGVAIFAYDSGSFNAAGGIVGDAGNGRKYNQFNTSGTLKVGSTSDFGIVTDSLGLHLDAGNFASRGASTVTDLSTNGNNMTVTGATLNSNYYYSFSGTSTYLTRASVASIKSTTALTLEAWIRITDLTNQWKPIFSKGNADGAEDYILMARPGNNVIYFDCGGGSLYAQPSFTWASNTWYHIVATHSKPSGTSTMSITINNNALSVTTNGATGAAGNTTDPLYIGTARNNTIGGTGIQIAQARIYTKVLSASEITQNYNATKTNFV